MGGGNPLTPPTEPGQALQPHPPPSLSDGATEPARNRRREEGSSKRETTGESERETTAEYSAAATFHSAAAEGDIPTLQKLVAVYPPAQRAAAVNTVDEDGLTPLHYASYIGDGTTVAFLLRCGADATAREPETGRTPMLAAVAHGHAQLLELFFAVQGGGPTQPSQRDALGNTALHLAAIHDRRDCANALLQRTSALVRARAEDGSLPVHAAAARGSAGVLEELLEAGDALTIGMEVKDNEGRTPFGLAAARLHERCLEILLQNGAKASAAGWAPVHCAAFDDRVGLIGDVDLREEDAQGMSAVHIAAGLGRMEALSEMLDRAAEVKALRIQRRCESLMSGLVNNNAPQAGAPAEVARHLSQCAEEKSALEEELSWDHSALCDLPSSKSLRTPLHVACHGGRLEVCVELLRRGAKVDAVDCHGWNVLHFCADAGSGDCIQVLIEHMTPEQRVALLRSQALRPEEATPLAIAAQQGNLVASEELLLAARDAGLSPVATAAELRAAVEQEEVLRMLCEEAQEAACAEGGVEALVKALRRGLVGAVCLLLDSAVPLHPRLLADVAASALPPQRRAQALHFLLQHVRPTSQALVTAASRGDVASVAVVLSSDSSLVDCVSGGLTPLQAALQAAVQEGAVPSSLPTVNLLLWRFGADPSLAGWGAPAPLCIAGEASEGLLKLLLQCGASCNECVVVEADTLDEEEPQDVLDADEDETPKPSPGRSRAPAWHKQRIAPLSDAAGAGNLRFVRLLLKSGALPEGTEGEGGVAPIVHAAQMRHWKCAAALLRAGARPNVYGEDGAGALWWALRNLREPACHRFLEGMIDEFAPPPLPAERGRKPPLTMRGARLRVAGAITEVKSSQFAVLQVAATDSAELAVRMLLGTAGQPRAKGTPNFNVIGNVAEGTSQVMDVLIHHGPDISVLIFTDSRARAGAISEELGRWHGRPNRKRPVSGPKICVLWRQEDDPRELNCCL
eukprot:Hpha_TRINITY_DN18349_c0_g1::TRINITY_DN18349_c0_g1_i1::g.158254::m.158254/K10380/ANK; ankyrin